MENEQNEQNIEQEQPLNQTNTGMRKYWLFVLAVIVLAVIVYFISVIMAKNIDGPSSAAPLVNESAEQMTEPLGESHSIEGREHIDMGEEHTGYKTNPPTSGPHYDTPADFGTYNDELIDEAVVHSLEHGGIWISYKNLDQEQINILEDIGKEYPDRTVVSPRSANDSNVVVASWGRLMKLDAPDTEKIVKYIELYTNQSPEKFAR